jgi:hypothetical protein
MPSTPGTTFITVANAATTEGAIQAAIGVVARDLAIRAGAADQNLAVGLLDHHARLAKGTGRYQRRLSSD